MNLSFEKTQESWVAAIEDEETGNVYTVTSSYDTNIDWTEIIIFDLQTDEEITEGEIYDAIMKLVNEQ